MIEFTADCFRLRQTKPGEELWQAFMVSKAQITEMGFLDECDVSGLLDDGETWEEWKEVVNITGYWSYQSSYMVTTDCGFEFFWIPKRQINITHEKHT